MSLKKNSFKTMVSQFELQKHKKFLVSKPVKTWLRENLAEQYSESRIAGFSEYIVSNLREINSAEKTLFTHSFKKLVDCSLQAFTLFYFGDYSQLVLVGLDSRDIKSAYPHIGDGRAILQEIIEELGN